MRVAGLVLWGALTPAPALAHDAFGDLGPFYASLLHPLADPLQGALLLGTAAFLAGRPLDTVRAALPVFAIAAAIAYAVLVAYPDRAAAPLLAAGVAMLTGLAATVPDPAIPRWAGYLLAAVTGALAGLASGAPEAGAALQAALGTLFGLSALMTLGWFALEAGARHLTPLLPKVAGSWVAAVGIMVAAFAL